jgi:hypothetical protein
MFNTIGTDTYSLAYRKKLFAKTFQQILKRSLVANAICDISKSGEKYIANPRSYTPTAVVQALAGTYSVSGWTTTEDTLVVADEFIYGEHVFDFEKKLLDFDILADRMEKISYAIKAAMDIWAVNNLCEDGTGTYTTPAGGFTTPANWPVIIANLNSKLAGYSTYVSNGFYIVVEAGDTVGLMQYQFGSGFSYADAALNNGLIGHIGGFDVYVVLDGTFVDAAATTVSGTDTWTNAGHRVAGVKRTATWSNTDASWEEKGVAGKTGVEICGYAYGGLKVWYNAAALTIDITVTT